MSRDESRDRRHREYGQSWEITAALWDGPKTLSEIMDHFHGHVRFLGFFRVTGRMERRHERMAKCIEQALGNLITRGWAVQQGECYALTPLGREEADKLLADMRRTRRLLSKLVKPRTVSMVGLGVHMALAAIKLPAALLSGSVGLLNDAFDTILDGFASVLVYLGIRFDRERVVNVVLVLFMSGAGGLTFYQAVRRFFVPVEPAVDWFTFLASILSVLICSGLWVYQRYTGLRSGSPVLITQSVDSRNHVIVAAGVTVGLIASLLGFPLIDTVVGLAVAIMILKSAIELAIDVMRSLGRAEADLSRYKVGIVSKYNQFRQTQLRDWMLYLVETHRVRSRTELVEQADQALDFSRNPMLRELGLNRSSRAGPMIEQGMANLFELGWFMGEERLSLTEAGKEHLGWDEDTSAATAGYAIQLPERGLTPSRNSVLVFSLADANEDDPPEVIDLTVEVVDAAGNVARLPLSHFALLRPQLIGQIGKAAFMSPLPMSEVVFQHFEFPLESFVATNSAFDPESLAQVRLIFDRTRAGVILLDDIGLRD